MERYLSSLLLVMALIAMAVGIVLWATRGKTSAPAPLRRRARTAIPRGGEVSATRADDPFAHAPLPQSDTELRR